MNCLKPCSSYIFIRIKKKNTSTSKRKHLRLKRARGHCYLFCASILILKQALFYMIRQLLDYYKTISRHSPVICARCMFLRCFTVISRISAFSSLECLELCGWKQRCNDQYRQFQLHNKSCTFNYRVITCYLKAEWKADAYVFFQGVQDERFELTQAFVDPSSSSFLHDGFRWLKKRGDMVWDTISTYKSVVLGFRNSGKEKKQKSS